MRRFGLARGASAPHTRIALRKAREAERVEEEQLELEDFINAIKQGITV